MTDEADKVAASIYKSLAKYKDLDAQIAMAALASVLCHLSIASGMTDWQSLDAFKRTLHDIKAKIRAEKNEKLH
jgi:hypothetical protein